MKRILLLAVLTVTGLYQSKAQLPYTLSVQTNQQYQALTNGTPVPGIGIWDEENFAVPTGFNFKVGDSTRNTFYSALSFPGGCLTDTVGFASGFLFTLSDIFDRGYPGGTVSKSPIRYRVDGSAGSRIFKMEYFNIGFFPEYDAYGTTDDSANIQIWVYETSNIVELRYGSSRITHPVDYFLFGNGPMIGYGKNVDFDNQNSGLVYYLSGTPTAPTIDSFNIASPTIPNVLTQYPDSGTVYRFTPIPSGVGVGHLAQLPNTKVYPTAATSLVTVDYNDNEAVQYQVLGLNGVITNLQGTMQRGKSNLDISGLPAGVYVLQLQNAQAKGIYKFVKL